MYIIQDVFVCWTRVEHTVCSDIESFHRSTQTEELTKFKVAVLKHFVQGNVVW